MVLDRSMKTLFAILTLVAALFLVMNHILDKEPIADWGLAIILLVTSAGFWIWMWQEDVAESKAIVVAESDAPVVQEWIISTGPDAQITRSAEAVKQAEATVRQELHRAATQTSETVTVEGKKPKKATPTAEPDDLQRIEGVGPKYADVLVEAGLGTFEAVAGATLKQLEEVVKAGGMRKTASMATWAEQAALAAKSDWDALDALQEKLSGGRRK